MASQNNMVTSTNSTRQAMRKGIVQKRSTVLKQWRQRFLVLNPETLCFFKKEGHEASGKTAKERIFLMDITSLDKTCTKKKKFCLTLVADGRTFVFNCASEVDRELWIRAIKNAQHKDQHLEENDPIRRKSMKLTGGLKRITIERKKGSGLGCTIKSVGGIIFVNRILEHGTVSSSGALRPGDQVLDVNGIELAGRSVAEISEIIRSCPEIVVCTVKPVTDFRVVDARGQAEKRADYAELDLSSLKPRLDDSSSGSEESLSDTSHPRTESGESEKVEENNSPEETKIEKHTEQQCYEEPKYDDVIPRNLQRRHSLPYQGANSDAQEGEGKESNLQYAELGFPTYDRPRLKSDTPTKPKTEHYKKPVKPIQAYAYIELDFNDKALQEPEYLRNHHLNDENRKS